jgi:hypothetical protein
VLCQYLFVVATKKQRPEFARILLAGNPLNLVTLVGVSDAVAVRSDLIGVGRIGSLGLGPLQGPRTSLLSHKVSVELLKLRH